MEGSQSHTLERAYQRSTSQRHRSLQRQRGLWFDMERILPSLHYLQIYTIHSGGKKVHFIQIRIINSNYVWTIVDPQRRKGEITRYLAFMPGLTSTVLSEAWTTRTVTSPDSGWFCRLRNSFTRFSRNVPSLVDGSPRNLQVTSSGVTKVHIYYYQSNFNTISHFCFSILERLSLTQWTWIWANSGR